METECLGGFGSMWGGQYHQQNRVYSMGDVALCLPAQIPGGSYLYLEIKKMDKILKVGGLADTQSRSVYDANGCSPTLMAGMDHGNTMPYILDNIKKVGYMNPKSNQREVVYDSNAVSPTIQAAAGTGGGQMPYILDTVYIKQSTKEGSIACEVGGCCNLRFPDSKDRRGRVIDGGMTAHTIQTAEIPSVIENWTWEIDGEIYLIRIRKLTPRECWRLMAFKDSDFDKAAEVNSNTQLYKQAGNSICVNVLEEIFKSLLGEDDER